MQDYPHVQLFVDGAWCVGSLGATLPVVDPATEETIGSVAVAETTDLDRAAAAAQRGFAAWSAVPAFERSKILRRAAGLLRERVEGIAYLLTREQGKPLKQAAMEVQAAADTLDWFAEEARRTYGQVIPSRAAEVLQMTMKVPVGPVAAFTPWNFPVTQCARKLGAALAAGCSVIVKAPEETPAAPAALIQALADAGVPAGAVNLVFGVPAAISDHLVPHPAIRKISFTGSTEVGKHLAALAGRYMKRATMELGGHAPVLVFEDADVEKAATIMAAAKMRNAGQNCVAPTRFFIQAPVFDRFLECFSGIVRQTKVGNGLDPESDMGPLANRRRIPALSALVDDAVSQGGRLVLGGRGIGNRGYFFEPTVLADVPISARIMNEEPFGPVAIVNRFSTFDEAVNEANRLPFGLAAYAFTGSNATRHRLALAVESGMLSINHYGVGLPEVPFGGVKDSGYGTEGGAEAVQPYLDTRFVTSA